MATMNRMKDSLCVAALVLAAGSVGAYATDAATFRKDIAMSSVTLPKGAGKADYAKYAQIDRRQAEKAALTAVPGEAVKAALHSEEGHLFWLVDVRQPNGGSESEVAIDAGNGKVLATRAKSTKKLLSHTQKERPAR
ncbi:MAG: PepSY domain-containing protein [Gammaproteobacteria bacterium]|nr:PepSY domain-containing protein [Gammaproteobacteria bacterium]